jgi:hypothetical protein
MLAGTTAIEARAGAATVRLVEPVIAPEVARIVVVPSNFADIRPPVVIVATLVVVDAQVTVVVRFCVLPSV